MNVLCAKTPHKTQIDARRSMERTIRIRGKRPNLKSGSKMAVYKCNICDAYHWGHHLGKGGSREPTNTRKALALWPDGRFEELLWGKALDLMAAKFLYRTDRRKKGLNIFLVTSHGAREIKRRRKNAARAKAAQK